MTFASASSYFGHTLPYRRLEEDENIQDRGPAIMCCTLSASTACFVGFSYIRDTDPNELLGQISLLAMGSIFACCAVCVCYSSTKDVQSVPRDSSSTIEHTNQAATTSLSHVDKV